MRAECPVCGGETNTRQPLNTKRRGVREISKHRPGGERVGSRSADPCCSGEGSLVLVGEKV